MKIGIITGASSGIGREIAYLVDKSSDYDIECLWLISRSKGKLLSLQTQLTTPVKVLPYDLTDPAMLNAYGGKLEEENPQVCLLVNCSGYGKFGRYDEVGLQDNLGMIDLNCRGLTALTQITVPYMKESKGRIVEIASVAGFLPLPNMSVYAATKAYVISYSRALSTELKKTGVSVTTVCPGWADTDFLNIAADTKNPKAVSRFGVVLTATKVARAALAGARKRRQMVTVGGVYKFMRVLVKITPHRLVKWIWYRIQSK